MSAALGPLLVAPLGWRMLFAIFSAIGIVVTLAYWCFGRSEPERGRALGSAALPIGPLERVVA